MKVSIKVATAVGAVSLALTPAKAQVPPVVESVPAMMRAYEVDGLAMSIVQDDTVLFARGYGRTADGEDYRSDTRCGLYSATKVLSSLVYASLAESQAIDIDQPIGAMLADAPTSWRPIPFYRLLNHSSGIPMIVNRPEFERLADDPDSENADIYRALRDLPLDYRPGEYSRYRQSGYAIAEMITAGRLGQTWPDLVASRVTGPAGATQTNHEQQHAGVQEPIIASAGGYETTADDMSRIFLALNGGRVVPRAWLEDFLYSEAYNFDGYSLGSILEDVDGVRTIGHRGGGARANIRYAPRAAIGVMICTDDRSNNELAIDLASIVMREMITGETQLLPVRMALSGYLDGPVDEFIAAFDAEWEREPRRYDFGRAESLVNGYGYELLGEDRAEEAVDVFRLNVRNHPASANAHDSLGEAQLASGDRAAALASYRRVLEIDPASANALAMIARIEGEMRSSE